MGLRSDDTPTPHDAPPVVYSSLNSAGAELQQRLVVPNRDNQPRSGFGPGAKVGIVAGLVANVSLALIWGVAQGQMNPATATMSDRIGQFVAVAIVVLLFGTPVALVLGFLAGGIGGGILKAADMSHRAPLAFGLIAAAFPMLVIAVPAGTSFRLTVAGTAVCFGVIGILAGRRFAQSFPDPS